MHETIDQCPACSHSGYQHFLSCQDYTVTNEHFNIVKCDKCDLLFTNPRPFVEGSGKYYESDDYISHHNKSQSLSDILYKIVRSYTLKSKVNLIKNYTDKGTLLDIGCGTGFFLNKASQSGLIVHGVEPNAVARKLASREGLMVNEDLIDYSDQTFDVITMWHVLEHVYDLNTFLHRLKNALNSNGTIFIAVPNSHSYDAQYYQEEWAAYDLPRHLYHFNQRTFKSTLKKHNLNIVQIVPMKFDAYYVSLLSERNSRPSIINYITFLLNGMKSNIYARKNNNNYSSLIYIIKKA